jgi:hypothetical protein
MDELRLLERKPWISQALCWWLPPVSSTMQPGIDGVGSTLVRWLTFANLGITGRFWVERSSSHTTRPVAHVARTPISRNPYHLQCCVFELSLTQNLQLGKKFGLSRWRLLGKNFRRILGLRNYRAARGRRGTTPQYGAAGREDLIAAAEGCVRGRRRAGAGHAAVDPRGSQAHPAGDPGARTGEREGMMIHILTMGHLDNVPVRPVPVSPRRDICHPPRGRQS